MKRVIGVLTALFLTGLCLTATSAGATQPEPNTNTVAYWCGSEDNGIKIDSPGDTFTVPEPPEGKVWTLLVLKAGSEEGGSVEEENEQFPDPVVGQEYERTDGKTISHAILCHEDEETPTTSTSSTSTTSTSTTSTSTTTTTAPPTTTTTAPPGVPSLFSVGGAGTVCVEGAPFITITFGARPDLDGEVGTLNFTAANGTDFGDVDLEFQSGETVQIVYPGATVDENGVATDFPGWELNADGFWVIDESDAFLREGLTLTYTLGDEEATADVTYPPETSTCASPTGPFPPGVTVPPTIPGNTGPFPGSPVVNSPVDSPSGSLPQTGASVVGLVLMGLSALGIGVALMYAKGRRDRLQLQRISK